MSNQETNNLSIARDALCFYCMGISVSSQDEEGYEGLIKDYKAEANHLAENMGPMTDQTSFDISVSNNIYTELTIEDMAQVLCIELDHITDVFKDLIVNIPQASVNRVKAAIDACKTLYHLVYSKDGLSEEEIEMIPPVELTLSFNFETQESPQDPVIGTVNVSLRVESTGSFDYLTIEHEPLSADDDVIVNAAIEWFYSTVREDFKPFDFDIS